MPEGLRAACAKWSPRSEQQSSRESTCEDQAKEGKRRTASCSAAFLSTSEEKLRNVDQSASNDQFITKGGRVAGPGETPILDVKIPGISKNIKVHMRKFV